MGEDPARPHAPVDEVAEGFVDEVGEDRPQEDEGEVGAEAEFTGKACRGEGEPQVGEEEHWHGEVWGCS